MTLSLDLLMKPNPRSDTYKPTGVMLVSHNPHQSRIYSTKTKMPKTNKETFLQITPLCPASEAQKESKDP